ncbi:MAG: tetratricopeptide repeat protein [Candidatus Hydrogenedentota bacterium]
MGNRISLAMIVKDEGQVLEECLESVEELVDEVCIVDTGSRDETREIAHNHGARVTGYLWSEDFGAARNESLRLCTKDWILVLDADERIAKEDIPAIKRLAKGPNAFAYEFITRNYTNATDIADFQPCEPDDPHARGFKGWHPSKKVRLFPNNAGVQFEGKVHELVEPSLGRARIDVEACDVPIHHYPHLKGLEHTRQKQEMYLRLGHEKVVEEPTDPKGYIELGNQYAEAGEYEKAAGAYREALQLDPSNATVLRDLGGVLHLAKRSEEGKKALLLALRIDPNLSSAWRNLGVVYLDQKQWPAAIESFQKALKTNPTWVDGYRYLSVAFEGKGDFAKAAEASQNALEARPDNPECLRLYIHQMLRLERRQEARNMLQHLIDERACVANVHNALGELYFYDQRLDDAKTHFTRAGRLGSAAGFNNLGVVLMQEARYSEAAGAFEQCLELEPSHHGALANLQKVRQRL